jgi:hypothetical protein
MQKTKHQVNVMASIPDAPKSTAICQESCAAIFQEALSSLKDERYQAQPPIVGKT